MLLCILSSPLIAATPAPEGKSGKRIAQIEKDFGVKFVQKAQVHLDGESSGEYWAFLKIDEKYSFKGYAFIVPSGASDKSVQNAIASAMCCASFYESFIQRMKEKASPTPSGFDI